MIVLPAIDLRQGKCVRLSQGDARRETVYSADPGAVAARFAAAGAEWLHVVDLDGAFAGSLSHLTAVRAIASTAGVKVQCGGGIRSLAAIERCLEAGAARAILGTIAHENPALLREAVVRFGDRIAVALDARGGAVAVRGWVEQTDTPALALARRVEDAGVHTIIFTDIAVDGMLAGPNFASLEQILAATRCAIIASGGIAALEHVRRLCALGHHPVAGCIIGRALYTGDLDLATVVALVRAQQHSSA